MFFNRMKHFGRMTNRRRDQRPTCRPATGLHVEGLERRRLLVGDLEVIAGDSNLDGQFNSSDLVQVFQQGKFETGTTASWADGDWNADEQFTTSDLVFAFQLGAYGETDATMVAAIDATTEETTDPTTETDDTTDPADDEADPECEVGEHGGRILNRIRGVGVQRVIHQLKDALANQGNLPGDLTVEEAQKLVDDLTAALTAGDQDAIGALLKTLHSEKLEDRIQGAIDRLKDRLADADLPGDITAEQLQKTIDDLTAALKAGDIDAAQKILQAFRQSVIDDHKQDQLEDRLQDRIDRLKEGIAANDPPGDLTLADAQRLLDALIAAQTSGDMTGVHDLQFTMRVEKLITKLNTAIADGTSIPFDLTKEAAETLVKGLQEALAAGNLDAARTLLQDLHKADAHDHGPAHPIPRPKPGRGHGRGHHQEDADVEDDTPADPVVEAPATNPAPPAGVIQAIMQRVARRRGR